MFNPETFVEELAQQTAHHLRRRAREFKAHRLGAIALEGAPWHQGLCLSVLIETDELRKWYMGDWEHQEFADLRGVAGFAEACAQLQVPKGKGTSHAPFFRCCARALCHPLVQVALQSYKLEPDFELHVADPDDFNEVNYCEEILGIDPSRRKARTEIVDDLDEALKAPESVLILKYWHHKRLTKRADQQIAQLCNLETLYFHSLGLTKLPPCVLALSRLKHLELNYNQLRDLTGLATRTCLEVLSLRDNGTLTPAMCEEIAALAALRELHVGECGLTEVPVAWQQLQQLETLYLFGNPIAALPKWLPALPSLKRLGLVEVVDDRTKHALRKRHPHLEIW